MSLTPEVVEAAASTPFSSVNTETIGTTATMIIRATAMNANADFIVDFILFYLSRRYVERLGDLNLPAFAPTGAKVFRTGAN